MEYFFIKTNRKFRKLMVDDIECIEAFKNYSIIHTMQGESQVLINLKRIEDFLEGLPFFRVHKSYIVSLHKILEFDMEFIKLNNKSIPIGPSYQQAFLEKIILLKMDIAE